ncbi:DUF3137 domain-containing protein [Pedobacter paludis]|uniref:Galanin n=1 Tax=Pedobacter paludis TaxID=2203212 RepID=A0A317F0W1_9SPHI|nr:DUF3137 domain-containing protein [Pedobacter paludis]PWS32784.1 galanin [Pedobacter paludis]
MSLSIDGNVALQNVLATLEVERKKIASTQTKGYLFIGGGILLGILGTVAGFPVPSILAGLVPIIFGGITLYRISDELRAYKDAFKRDVIGTALKNLDQSLTIDPYKGIYEPEFIGSQLFKTDPDRYSTEDLVRGVAGKTGFYFAEVHAEYKTEVRTKNGTRTEWHDIFKGIIFVADFNKNFNGVTIVRPKDIGSSIGAWFSKNVFSFGNNDVVQLENTAFCKEFITYANDQVEARYILTPAMMERILELNSRAKYTLTMSFISSRMYIGFPLDRNYFEAPIFKTLLNPDLLNEDISTINFMYDIIRELDLNTRIWGKN